MEITDLINKIISFLLNPPFHGWVGLARIVYIVLSLLMVGSFIYFFRKASWFRMAYLEDTSEFLTFKPHGARKMLKTWNKIKARLETGSESEYKLAVIEADSMLDDVLNKLDYKGENLAERLTKVSVVTLPNIEELKDCHEVRNNIIHNPDYNLPLDEARRILDIYEKTLSELQIF